MGLDKGRIIGKRGLAQRAFPSEKKSNDHFDYIFYNHPQLPFAAFVQFVIIRLFVTTAATCWHTQSAFLNRFRIVAYHCLYCFRFHCSALLFDSTFVLERHHSNKTHFLKINFRSGIGCICEKNPRRDRRGIIFSKKGGLGGILHRKLTTFYDSQHNGRCSRLLADVLPERVTDRSGPSTLAVRWICCSPCPNPNRSYPSTSDTSVEDLLGTRQCLGSWPL